jgi:hypothetical protein
MLCYFKGTFSCQEVCVLSGGVWHIRDLCLAVLYYFNLFRSVLLFRVLSIRDSRLAISPHVHFACTLYDCKTCIKLTWYMFSFCNTCFRFAISQHHTTYKRFCGPPELKHCKSSGCVCDGPPKTELVFFLLRGCKRWTMGGANLAKRPLVNRSVGRTKSKKFFCHRRVYLSSD